MSRLRYLTAGESHGPGLTAVLDGCPAGLAVDAGADRRRARAGARAATAAASGRASSRTACASSAACGTGAPPARPLALFVPNRDAANWGDVLAVEAPAEGRDAPEPVVVPAPGPRRPRRRPAVRPRRHPRRHRARQRARDGGQGRLRRGRQAPARRPRLHGRQPRGRHRRRSTARAGHEPRRRRARRGEPGALPRRGGRAAHDAPPSTRPRRPATRSAASSRCSPSATRRASAPTCRATSACARRLAGAVLSVPAIVGVEFGLGLRRGRRCPGSRVHDPIAHDAGARVRAREQRLRRHRGRHLDRRDDRRCAPR